MQGGQEPTNEDSGSPTANAQSTAHTKFTGAAKSDVVQLIVVSWTFLLQTYGAEQIGHTRWPTEVSAHACEEINTKPTLNVCIPTNTRHT